MISVALGECFGYVKGSVRQGKWQYHRGQGQYCLSTHFDTDAADVMMTAYISVETAVNRLSVRGSFGFWMRRQRRRSCVQYCTL